MQSGSLFVKIGNEFVKPNGYGFWPRFKFLFRPELLRICLGQECGQKFLKKERIGTPCQGTSMFRIQYSEAISICSQWLPDGGQYGSGPSTAIGTPVTGGTSRLIRSRTRTTGTLTTRSSLATHFFSSVSAEVFTIRPLRQPPTILPTSSIS